MSEPLPPCEFRTLDRSGVYRCDAAEGASLGPRDGELVQQICGSCSVPAVLASDRSCLHLIAWAEVEDARSEGKFACRFFHPLYDAPWDDIGVCATCPYWFPRPPLELLPDHAEWIARMKDFYTSEGQAKDRGASTGRRLEPARYRSEAGPAQAAAALMDERGERARERRAILWGGALLAAAAVVGLGFAPSVALLWFVLLFFAVA